ncbi:hypothetical protein LUZ63_008346 [Rhynchospora breviuscula]|uniref:Uncharacterized protein n=1 Tax=Rhynchospora breviuscula TaxID=2022672 RepID=A0A9Q0CTD7_9POAL|nr:hypothetical protein LUZ63_008346 [Rhynchospora breviuscula]
MAEAVVILAFVGKAVASSVITNLVNRAFTKFDELRKSEGMKATKEKLDQNLPRIAAVLLAVDRGQIMDRNGALDKWLWQLRDAVEEAEDAIDQLDYYQLKEKVKYQADPHSACTTSIKKKMTKLINKHVPCIGNDSLGRLKKAVEGLNNAAAGVGPFLQLVNTLGNSSGGMNQTPADTGAMLTEAKVFGRDMEKDLILKWLSNPDGPEVSAFSIVGMGGLGKTTLARLIYNEIAVKKVLEFSLVVWVSVSDIFGTPDAKVIIRMILQDITQSSYDLNNLNTLQTSLKKKVETEKFLIIFDDVWQEGPETENQWKQIMAPLKFGQKGSKILLTTRMEVVANMMAKVMEGIRQKNNHLLLGGLEEHEFLKLFNKHIFGTENPTEHKNCQRLAKQVVKKLWGSPLAVRVMENLLNNRTDIQHWDQITKQDISNIQIDQNEIMASLKKSYHHLREEEQLCFRYCSLFPQDHKFKRDELIKMWIGSGLIQQSDSTQTLEESGAGYFDTLMRKSFFHASADSEDCYLMHDFMHEMAAFVSSGECLRTKTVSSERIPGTIRHICIIIHSLIAIKEISHLRHLQSLFVEFEGENPELADVKEFEKALKELKSLRLLRLTGNNLFELPKVVGDLIHLRYISVRQTSEKELNWLPKSISSLYHLKIMGFLAVSVNGVTKDKLYGMGNLISLQYLDVPPSVMEMIPRIGKLTSLQKLELFNSQEQGRNISELGSLNSISELQINSLEKLNDSEEANKAKIKEKERLRVLSLNWSSECTNSKMTLENLEPHNSIQKLHISGYTDASFPKWISNSIPNLTSLELRDCARCNTLPPLGKLLSLKYLLLSNFHELELIPAAFYGRIPGGGDTFPSLKELRISSMNILRKWEDIEGRRKFPRLEKLLIEGCPQLTTLPTLPVSISNLEIKNSGLQTLPMGIESLKKLRLVGCQMLLFNQTQHNGLPSSLEELIIQGFCDDTSLVSSLRNLVTLTRLELTSCSNITSLPQEDVFFKLVSLCEICIQKCTKLSSFGGLGALTSLKVLRLSGCSNLVTIPLPQSPSDLDSEEPNLEIQQLHIDHISLLLQKPLKSVCQVKKLHILDNHQPESLPKQWLEDCTSLEEIEIGNAGALKGLPSNFDELLPGLKKLVMHQANLFESLPNLPPSLSDLVITGCNDTFKQKYKKDTGSNWYELTDVTTVIVL